MSMQKTLSCVWNVLCTQDVRYTPRGPGTCASLRASRNDGRLRERRLLLPHHSGLWILQSCQAQLGQRSCAGQRPSADLEDGCTAGALSPLLSTIVPILLTPALSQGAPLHNTTLLLAVSVLQADHSLSGRFSQVSCMALPGTALAGNCSWCTSLHTGNVKPLVLNLVRIAASLRCSH